MTKESKIILFIITILLIIYSIIIEIYCNKVHAQTTTISALNSNSTNWQWNTTANSYVQQLDVSKFSPIYNIGEGVLNFTISIEGQYKVYGIEFIYRRSGTNKSSECQIGTNLNYKDSGSQIQTITSVCNINMDFTPTEVDIYVYGYSWGNLWYGGISNQITFSNFKDSNDYNTVLNNATEYLRVISVYTQYNNTDIYAIRSTLETIMTNLNTNNTELKNAITQQTQQQHQDSQNINNSIQDTNNTLKDSSIDSSNTSSSTSEWNNKVASNGTITNLLTLPIQLMQGYVNGMNSSCTPFNLGNLFGTTIILPCINVGNLIGSSLWSVIDVLFSGFMIFGIAKKLIKIFNDFTNMKSNQVDELYGGGA